MLLRRGEGVRLPITEIRLEFRRGTGPGIPRAELYALLRDGGGEAGGSGAAAPVSAADPLHRSGAVGHSRVRHPDGMAVDTLTVRLASLDAAVSAVRLVVRAEGGPAGRIPLLRLRALAEGRQPVRLDCAGLVPGRTVVVGECYREGGGWLLRALYETAPPLPPAARAPAPAGERPANGTPLDGGLLRVGFTPLPEPGSDPGQADLCALVELADGRKGVVQPLGAAHGSLRTPPYVRLDAPAGELAVDLDQAARLRRVLVFLALRTGCFTRTSGTVAVRTGEGPLGGVGVGGGFGFDLAPAPAPSTACALLLLTARDGRLHLRREAHHLPARPGLSPQRTADYAYGWGLRWAPPPSGP